MAKKNRASKADVQSTELNRLPVQDAEFANEYESEQGRQQKKAKKNKF